jgi:hypothetical protein
MNNIIKIIEQDVIFLSYDEPNAEQNYADLLRKVPWAKRVHGIDGSDTAHKACAALSDTEYFVTVDADNLINSAFLQVEIDLVKLGLTQANVFSWCGRVHVNGLMYGNGGLKLWTRQFVNNMRTHENANLSNAESLIEFCFDENYHRLNESYSESFTNATPLQAWRAGFREGVKLSLSNGVKVSDLTMNWRRNNDRLLVWCNVGSDVTNGLWSILGAREGCYKTMCTDWDHTQVRDFNWLNTYWRENLSQYNDELLKFHIDQYGNNLTTRCGLVMSVLDASGSTFFKRVYNNATRTFR